MTCVAIVVCNTSTNYNQVGIHIVAVMSGVMGIVPVMMSSLVVGCDYPGSLPQLRRWFTSDEDCADYLDWCCTSRRVTMARRGG